MVVIEPERTEEESKPVGPKQKPKPSMVGTTNTTFESISSPNAVLEDGGTSDGFETASDSELDVGDGGKCAEKKHQLQQKESEIQTSAVMDDSFKASSCDDELRQKALAEANEAKLEGNRLFGIGQYDEALFQYETALQVAPEMPASVGVRSICHANRAICFLKMSKYEDAIKECTKALELNPNYVKALLRRGEAHEKLEHYEEAIADMKKILELDQSDVHSRRTVHRLEPLAAEKREKMKEEMIGKLKEMGNSVLGRFGMSIDNFKAVKDPNTGSYSISFQR